MVCGNDINMKWLSHKRIEFGFEWSEINFRIYIIALSINFYCILHHIDKKKPFTTSFFQPARKSGSGKWVPYMKKISFIFIEFMYTVCDSGLTLLTSTLNVFPPDNIYPKPKIYLFSSDGNCENWYSAASSAIECVGR